MNRVIGDLRERFLNFESLAGALLTAAGVAQLLRPEYVLTWLALFALVTGLRMMLVNRVRQRRRQERLLSDRVRRERGLSVALWPILLLLALGRLSAPDGPEHRISSHRRSRGPDPGVRSATRSENTCERP